MKNERPPYWKLTFGFDFDHLPEICTLFCITHSLTAALDQLRVVASSTLTTLMQNNVQIWGKWSKSKPKVNFQYNGRLFFKNGSSYISANN